MSERMTGAELIDLLHRSRLLADSLFIQVRAQLNESRADQRSAEDVADALIQHRIVTRYHAEQLLQGRYKGFYFGSYKLLDLLGYGGMGCVYLAEQLRLQRLVALKAIRRRVDADSTVEQFEREARAVASLQHANIIQAIDYDQLGGVPYLVMEFVEGLDLERIVEKFGALPVSSAAEFVRQAALGLQHAYECGMVHRDIKPANLLVDTEGTVKVLDLGIATTIEHNGPDPQGLHRVALGSVDYIAPEQIRDPGSVDTRADIYSLGAVLYAIIAGQPPFHGRTPDDKLRLHRRKQPPRIQALVPDVPRGLASVIRKMLSKRREDRFTEPGEVYDALSPFARRVTPPYDTSAVPFRRRDLAHFLRRSPGMSEIAALLAGMPLAAADGVPWR